MSFRRLFVGVFACVCALLTLAPAHATDYYVTLTGDDANPGLTLDTAKRTIQAGLDAASEGDTVLVADGTYSGPGNYDLTFRGKNLTLRSLSDVSSWCIIDCRSQGRAFLFVNGEKSALVRGFTIKRGQNYFEENNPHASSGGAVLVVGTSVSFFDCSFRDNDASRDSARNFGGAIFADAATLTLERCHFDNNQARGTKGASTLR